MNLQVNVSNELVKWVDEYAEMMGISRSALCAIFIGQGVLSYNTSFSCFPVQGGSLSSCVGNCPCGRGPGKPPA